MCLFCFADPTCLLIQSVEESTHVQIEIMRFWHKEAFKKHADR